MHVRLAYGSGIYERHASRGKNAQIRIPSRVSIDAFVTVTCLMALGLNCQKCHFLASAPPYESSRLLTASCSMAPAISHLLVNNIYSLLCRSYSLWTWSTPNCHRDKGWLETYIPHTPDLFNRSIERLSAIGVKVLWTLSKISSERSRRS